MTQIDPTIDWNAVRSSAYECLDATWNLGCWADRALDDDDQKHPTLLHLEVITRAATTFKKSSLVLLPGFPGASSDSGKYSPIFDAIQLATASIESKPISWFSEVAFASAHEAAFELLRRALIRVEDTIHAIGLSGIAEIEDFTGATLRAILRAISSSSVSQPALSSIEVNQLRAWIDREWAAVVRFGDTDVVTVNGHCGCRVDNPEPNETETIIGVSLHDAMMHLDDDAEAASAEVKRFSKSTHEAPERVGKCPHDGRRYLHKVDDLVRCMKNFYGLNSSETKRLRAFLKTKTREPLTK
ncbi:hypothetical protein FF011L_05620 [Roseimaritima multifibrata]|uniref:Uncharacterized protein n=1 Tax=Roseimaritima multifibrata TaxID=1930274 RepID=A0A517MAL9_9BACT|nr:hypothetical protein [Roseimaritima multifibrata]QDS91827.1 hypothetical protein FF011L_05620 [Roseimaritima multifibrata]